MAEVAAVEKIRLAVSVMAYPAISTRHGEVVCVAGFRTDTLMTPDWVRLFPFHVRDMPPALRVRKWDEIELTAVRTSSDSRPETWMPNMDSVKVVGHLGTARRWEARRALVDPLRSGLTMRGVEDRHAADGTSLAVVETGQVLDLEVTRRPAGEVAAAREKARREAAQGSLFSLEDREPLEPIPFDFHYVVQYDDDPEPRRLKVIDWEINQAYRKYRSSYAQPEQVIRERWLNELCNARKDTAFFVGNQLRFQTQWLLLGVFWPATA